jgi:hypothetical protein
MCSVAEGSSMQEHALTTDPKEKPGCASLYWEVPPRQRTSLLTMARAAADVLPE